MTIYKLEISKFYSIKRRLDSLIFWRVQNGIILTKQAIPDKEITNLLKTNQL